MSRRLRLVYAATAKSRVCLQPCTAMRTAAATMSRARQHSRGSASPDDANTITHAQMARMAQLRRLLPASAQTLLRPHLPRGSVSARAMDVARV